MTHAAGAGYLGLAGDGWSGRSGSSTSRPVAAAAQSVPRSTDLSVAPRVRAADTASSPAARTRSTDAATGALSLDRTGRTVAAASSYRRGADRSLTLPPSPDIGGGEAADGVVSHLDPSPWTASGRACTRAHLAVASSCSPPSAPAGGLGLRHVARLTEAMSPSARDKLGLVARVAAPATSAGYPSTDAHADHTDKTDRPMRSYAHTTPSTSTYACL